MILRFEGLPIPKECEEQFNMILKKTPCIIDSIIDQCLQINNMLPKTDKRYLGV